MNFLDVVKEFFQEGMNPESGALNRRIPCEINLKEKDDCNLYEILPSGKIASKKFTIFPKKNSQEPFNMLIAAPKEDSKFNVLAQFYLNKNRVLMIDLDGSTSPLYADFTPSNFRVVDFKNDMFNIFGVNLGFTDYSDVQAQLIALALMELAIDIDVSDDSKGKITLFFHHLLRYKKFLKSCRNKYQYKPGVNPEIDKIVTRKLKDVSGKTWIEISHKLLIEKYDEEALWAANYGSPKIEDFIPFAKKNLDSQRLTQVDKDVVQKILLNLEKLIEIYPTFNQPTSFDTSKYEMLIFSFADLMKTSPGYKNFFVSSALLFNHISFNINFFIKQVSDIREREVMVSSADLPIVRNWRVLKKSLDDVDLMHLYQFSASEYDSKIKHLFLIGCDDYQNVPLLELTLKEARLNNLSVIGTTSNCLSPALMNLFRYQINKKQSLDGADIPSCDWCLKVNCLC